MSTARVGNSSQNPSWFTNVKHRFSSVFSASKPTSFPSALDQQDPRHIGKAVIVGPSRRASGEYPDITNLTLYNYYKRIPKVKTVVDTLVEQIKSRNYNFNVKGANASKALNVLETFDHNARLRHSIEYMARDGFVCGESFIEMLDPEDLQRLQPLQISTVWRVHRNEDGSYKDIEQRVDGQYNSLDPNRFLHFKFIDADRSAHGIGLLHALAMPQVIDGVIRPSILDNYSKICDVVVRTMERYGAPFVVGIYEDANDQYLENEAVKIRDGQPGEFYLTNKKFDMHEVGINVASRFDGYLKFYDDLLDAGLQHPINRLLTNPSALADARAVIKMADEKLFGMEDRIAELINTAIIPRVLQANGINPYSVEARFDWGAQDDDSYEFEDIFTAYEKGLLTPKEARRMLRKAKAWQLDETPLDNPDFPKNANPGQPLDMKGDDNKDPDKDGDDDTDPKNDDDKDQEDEDDAEDIPEEK